MRSPRRMMQDWSAKKALKQQLLQALRQVRPGSPDGIDLPSNEPLYAVAAQELLKEHPQLRVIKAKDGLTLIRAEGVQMSGGLLQQLVNDGRIVGAGAVLHDDL